MSLKPVNREELHAVIDWTRDYVNGTGARGVLLGLSGGADSAATAAILAQAIGTDRVLAIGIPIDSAAYALEDAHKLAEWLGITMIDRSLDGTFTTFMREAQIKEHRAYLYASDEQRVKANGNVKARLRTTLARFWAEINGYLFVNTCNWSETIVGYDTKGGGDADGDFSILMQFVKQDVWDILALLGAPQWIIDKIPSADLEGETEDGQRQSDETDLQMTYAELDRFASAMATGGASEVEHLADPTSKRERFFQLVSATRHKRAPMPVFKREGFNYEEK